MRFAAVACISLTLATTFAACGGSTGDDTGATSTAVIPRERFAARFADAICENIGGCCQSSGFQYDAAKCKLAASEALPPSTADTDYDPSAAAACIEAVTNAARACRKVWDAEALSCNRAYRGRVATGGACIHTAECAQPAHGGAWCEEGVCKADTAAQFGERCSATCTELGTSGGECSSTEASDDVPNGATCWKNDGLVCSKGVCAEVQRVGQPCTNDECADGAYCKQGTCAALVPIGQPCSDDECARGAACIDGVCTQFDCVGDTCSGSSIVTPSLCGGTP